MSHLLKYSLTVKISLAYLLKMFDQKNFYYFLVNLNKKNLNATCEVNVKLNELR